MTTTSPSAPAIHRIVRSPSGVISFEDVETKPHAAKPAANEPSQTPRGDIAKLLDLADQAGGLDAIERLLGGGDAPPVQT